MSESISKVRNGRKPAELTESLISVQFILSEPTSSTLWDHAFLSDAAIDALKLER